MSFTDFQTETYSYRKESQDISTRPSAFFEDNDSYYEAERAFQRDFLEPELQDVLECEAYDDFALVEEVEQMADPKEFGPMADPEELSSEVLKTKPIKKLTTKNNNLPKFLIRVFMKETAKVARQDEIDSYDFKRLEQIKRDLKSRGANIWTTKDLLNIFGHDDTTNFRKINRMIMNKTLREKLKAEIINNSKVRKSKLSSLIASKVYGLRLRSEQLAKRVQSR